MTSLLTNRRLVLSIVTLAAASLWTTNALAIYPYFGGSMYSNNGYNYYSTMPTYNTNYYASCGSLTFSCTGGSVPRCINGQWACYGVNDTSYLNAYRYNYYNGVTGSCGHRTINTNPCWATPPDCQGWILRCTSQGWRCDPPAYGGNPYPYDGSNYHYLNSNNYYYNSCLPSVACSGPNASCPSGTYCGAYRNGFACLPTYCSSNFAW